MRRWVGFLIFSWLSWTCSHSFASAKLNIHFQVSKNLQETVLAAKTSLQEKGYNPISASLAPHLTIYMTKFDKHRVDDIRKFIKQACRSTKTIPVAIAGWTYTPSDWVFLDLIPNPQMGQIHQTFINTLKAYRPKGEVRVPGWMKSQYPDRIPLLKEFGSIWVHPHYKPHFSLLTHKTGPAAKEYIVGTPWQRKTKGQLTGIGIASANQEGQFKSVDWSCNFLQN